MAKKSDQHRRLDQIAADIRDLHGAVRAYAAEHPAKRGQPAPTPNPILRTHHRIGELVQEFMELHKALYGRGNNAVEALSTRLAGALKPTHLYNHAKYARFPRRVVEDHVEKGHPWRDVAKLKPKQTHNDLVSGASPGDSRRGRGRT